VLLAVFPARDALAAYWFAVVDWRCGRACREGQRQAGDRGGARRRGQGCREPGGPEQGS